MRIVVYCLDTATTLNVVKIMFDNYKWPHLRIDTVRVGQRVIIENATDAILTYLRTHVPSIEINTEV